MFAAARQTMCGNRRRKFREPKHPVSTDLSYARPTSVCFLRQEEAFVSQLSTRGRTASIVMRCVMASRHRVCRDGWNWLVGLSRRCMMGRKLYVGNLGYDVSDSDLEKLFAGHGTVDTVNVITDRSTGQSKGFGFVEMNSDAEAAAAIAALDGKELGGRTIKVNEAKPKPAGGGGGGGGGGVGGRRERLYTAYAQSSLAYGSIRRCGCAGTPTRLEHFPFSYVGFTACGDASDDEEPRGPKPAAGDQQTGNALAFTGAPARLLGRPRNEMSSATVAQRRRSWNGKEEIVSSQTRTRGRKTATRTPKIAEGR